MKHTVHAYSAAILIGLSGMANASTASVSTDGFFIETTAHPHEETKHNTHQVWIQRVSDGDHVYELRIEDGEYFVSVDGDQVPQNQIKKTKNAVVVLKTDGGELHEFDLTLTETGRANLQKTHSMRFNPSNQTGHFVGVSSNINQGNLTLEANLKPKVMLGVYTDEPGESLRKQLGIKGHAILIEKVIKGLSADQAGIKDHDIIISIDDTNSVSPEQLTEILSTKKPGDEIKIVVLRNGQLKKINTALLAYDAKALGRTPSSENDRNQIRLIDPKNSGTVLVPPTPPSPIQFFDSTEIQERTHQKIIEALRQEGIGEKKIAEIEKQIRASLEENVWRPLAQDRSAEQWFAWNNLSGENRQLNAHRLLPENIQQKAEDAIRHAERLTLEYKDGQLLLKRHAKDLEDKIQTLHEQVQETMPKVESELQGRLVELEDRLDQLESALDSKMDSLSGLIEQLIDRLDED